MHVVADRSELSDALTWACSAVAEHPEIPALSAVLLMAEGTELGLRGADISRVHTATVEAGVLAPGSVALPAAVLAGVVGNLRDADDVHVWLAPGQPVAHVTSGRSHYRLPVLAARDFPSHPLTPEPCGKVEADELRLMARTIRHSLDDRNPAVDLMGMRLEAGARLVGFGATSSRFSAYTTAWDGAPMRAHLRWRSFADAVRGLTGPVELGEGHGSLTLRDARRSVVARCYRSKPFDPERFTRSEADPVLAIVERDELLGAVGRVACTCDEHDPMRLRVADQTLRVESTTELGEGSELVTITGDIDPGLTTVDVLLDAARLGRLLEDMPKGTHVVVELAGPRKAVRLRTEDGSTVHTLAPRREL